MSDYALVLANTLRFDASTENNLKQFIAGQALEPLVFTQNEDGVGIDIDLYRDDYLLCLFSDEHFLDVLARGNAIGMVCFGETGCLPGFRMWGVEFKKGRYHPVKGKIRWDMDV